MVKMFSGYFLGCVISFFYDFTQPCSALRSSNYKANVVYFHLTTTPRV